MIKAKTISIRVPPQSIPSEQAALGSIMLRKDAMHEVEDIINPDSFYVEKNKIIFRAMLDLSLKNEPIDMLSLSTKLSEQKVLERIGGNQYLAELVSVVPSSTNVKHYAEIVQKKYVLRSLIEAADYVSELGFEESDDHMNDILDMAEKKIFSVISSPKNQKFINLKDALPEAWERLERLHEHKGMLRGLPTGFRDLDTTLSGLQKSDLIILAARPSMGKTSLALDILRHVGVNQRKSVGIFSLEMSKDQLVDRLLSAQSDVNLWKIRTGHLNEADFENIGEAMGQLSEAQVFIDDAAGSNIMEVRTKARRLQAETDLALIVVDYLQLMEGRNQENRVQEVSEISRSLKILARELNVPVLALSQLSRNVENRPDKVPVLADLRESGSIEQDADVVMFIYREDMYKGKDSRRPNIAELHIRKHRNGPTGAVDLYFDQDRTSFKNLDKTFDASPQAVMESVSPPGEGV